ncbi:MAG: tetratricopeptide repeat protein [Polyangiales bacterium]
MLKTSLRVALALTALLAAAVMTKELRVREDARRLVAEAEQVLRPPLTRAPELSRIDATRACSLLDQAERMHPDAHTAAMLSFAKALEEHQKGRPDQARAALARARRGLPASADLDVLEAAIALQSGRQADASASAARALAREPRHLRARALIADITADAGDPQRALSLLKSLIAEAPGIGTLHNRRGLAYEALGDRSAAAADFERAAELDPSLPQPHINLGRLLRDQGRLREAEQEFGLAITRGPSEAQAWLGRGLSRIGRGDVEGGSIDIEQARALAPAEPGPLLALADLDVWHGRLEQAVERYRAAVVLAGSDAVAWLKLGNALARTRAYEAARSAFEHALELQPALAAAHNGLGAALMGMGDQAGAEKAFGTAVALDRSDPNPARNLALLRERAGHGNGRRPRRARSAQPRASLD